MNYGRLGLTDPDGSSRRSISNEPHSHTRKCKLKFLLIVAAILIVASAISAAMLVVLRKNAGLAETRLRRPSQAISRICGQTRSRSLCVNSLLDFPGASTASDKDLVHITVNMTLQHFGRALYVASEISNVDMDLHVRSAYEDCMELLDDSVDLLSRSLASVSSSVGSTQDIMTWLSAALTNHDTCSDGFEQLNGYVKNQMLDRLKNLSELVSSCLAIFAAVGRNKDFSGVPIQNKRRRLLNSDNEEHGKFPKWLSGRDRRLLFMPASAIQADIIVSKDGNGTFKTIAEAIKKAPEYSNRRFIIYVKAGK